MPQSRYAQNGRHILLQAAAVFVVGSACVELILAHTLMSALEANFLYAPDTSSRNRRQKFDARFRRQFFCADARVLTSSTAWVWHADQLGDGWLQCTSQLCTTEIYYTLL